MLTKNEKFELYIATDKYFEDGEKKLITSSNDIYDVEVYEGKVYYIDSSNSLKIYDIDTEKTEQYEIPNITPHYNTKILPGNKYTIISQINKYELIDLESKTNKIIDTNNAMGYGVFDSNNNTLYYSDINKIYGMDILSNKKTEINVAKANTRYIDNNKLYIEGEEGIRNSLS